MTQIKEVTERLNTKSMWMFYVDDLHKDINKLKQEMGGNTFLKNKFTAEIEQYVDFIALTLDCDVPTLLNLTTQKQVDELEFKNLHIFDNGEKQKALLILKLSKLVAIKAALEKQQKEFSKLKERDIAYPNYAFILREFNLRIVDKIIEGYTLNLGYNIGEIKIKKKKRVTARVNWNESYKLRELILNEGGILFDKDEQPEGEKWIVKFTDDEAFWVYWSKVKCKVPNKLYYSFVPVRGNYYNVISKLHNYIANNPMVKVLYD